MSRFTEPEISRSELSGLEELSKLLESTAAGLLKGETPKEAHQQEQSWLEWGMDLVKQYGPMLIELAPELIALL